jgi:EpsI family protein
MNNRIILLCLILLAAWAFIAQVSKPEVVQLREPLSEMPMRIGDWEGRQVPDMDSRVLSILGVDDYINRVYYSPELFPASLYIGFYHSQREGDTIHSPLNCLPGAGWNPVKSDRIPIPGSGNSSAVINRIVILKGIDKQVVLYWYQSHGRVIASEYWGKIYTVLDSLRTNRTDAALVRVICPVTGTDAQAEAFAERRAMEFVKALYPQLARFIPV